MTNKIKGFVIARMLEDNGKIKPFTYYPSKLHGRPPFLFKNKKSATNKMKSKSMNFYKFGTELRVVKFKQSMYLDRI